MEESANRIREKMAKRGFPVMSQEELDRYQPLEKDARIISFKEITGDLQKRSGLFTGRYCSLADYNPSLNKVEGSYSKEDQSGRKAKK